MAPGATSVPVAPTPLRLPRLGARHYGWLSLCDYLIPCHERATGHDAKFDHRLVWRHRVEHFYARLGPRRADFWTYCRPLWAGQNHGADHLDLCRFYRPVRHRQQLAGARGLPLLDRVRHRRRMVGRRRADRGELARAIASEGRRYHAVLRRHRLLSCVIALLGRWTLRMALGVRLWHFAGARRLLHSPLARRTRTLAPGAGVEQSAPGNFQETSPA